MTNKNSPIRSFQLALCSYELKITGNRCVLQASLPETRCWRLHQQASCIPTRFSEPNSYVKYPTISYLGAGRFSIQTGKALLCPLSLCDPAIHISQDLWTKDICYMLVDLDFQQISACQDVFRVREKHEAFTTFCPPWSLSYFSFRASRV